VVSEYMDIDRESGQSVMIATMLGRRTFRAVPEQAREARRWLRALLGDGCEDAPECLSEIFANAVLHTASGATQGPVSVVVLDVGPRVRVQVTDAGAATKPHLRSPDDGTPCGRGLLIVDALTGGRWGWDDQRAARRVWFEVPRR
jgi:anti-sigma regulatory factor (Ser/Thr protein kinase)